MDASIASSQKPVAGSDLAPDKTAKLHQALSNLSSPFKPFKPFQALSSLFKLQALCYKKRDREKM
jgi:hypothetical protein